MDLGKLFAQAEQPSVITKVTDLETATRVAKEVTDINKQLATFATAYNAELAELEVKMKDVKTRYDKSMLPLQAELATKRALLVDYHKETMANASESEQKSLTSIKLPYGVTLSSRAQAVKLDVTDSEKYVAYAKRHGLIKVKEDVEWAKLKKTLEVREDGTVIDTKTNEQVDFITPVEQERTYDVKWD